MAEVNYDRFSGHNSPKASNPPGPGWRPPAARDPSGHESADYGMSPGDGATPEGYGPDDKADIEYDEHGQTVECNDDDPTGIDTVDTDPTVGLQHMQEQLINEQGGTEFTGVYDRARGKHQPNDGEGDIVDMEGEDDYHSYTPAQGAADTPGEYRSRNFGPEDNVTRDDGYGDFYL